MSDLFEIKYKNVPPPGFYFALVMSADVEFGKQVQFAFDLCDSNLGMGFASTVYKTCPLSTSSRSLLFRTISAIIGTPDPDEVDDVLYKYGLQSLFGFTVFVELSHRKSCLGIPYAIVKNITHVGYPISI